MCGLFGYIDHNQKERLKEISELLKANSYRGFDGWGVLTKSRTTKGVAVNKSKNSEHSIEEVLNKIYSSDFALGNFRAQPLPEVPSLDTGNVHPFFEGGRTYIVHNGTISNDRELEARYNLPPHTVDSQVIAQLYNLNIKATNNDVESAIQKTCSVLEGAYVFILYDSVIDRLIIVKNYQPLHVHYAPTKYLYFGSEVPVDYKLEYASFPAYSAIVVNPHSIVIEKQFSVENDVASKHILQKDNTRSVVVCSGGLDSSTAAFISKKMLGFKDTIIINMNLGQRGWQSEKRSSSMVAKMLGAKYVHLDIRNIFNKFTKTPLTDYSIEVTKGVHSAESPTEWVTMRNTILSSISAGLAETYGASAILTGCNMEEESAYPDNSITWIHAFSNMVQHGSLHGIKMIPVDSHLMKKDIITLGSALGVPFQHTTSCYDPIDVNVSTDKMRITQAKALGLTHIPCGSCGCCCLRRHAFLAARIRDPYESLYMYDMEKFSSYDYFMSQIKQHGYIDITDETWKKNTIEKYKQRIEVLV
jgi:7-cyano-7-deazaguanine synthase